MMKYEKAILEHLLDKYERSKSFTGDNRIGQNFSVKLVKLFPKYGDEAEYDLFCSLNDTVSELESMEYITSKRKKNGIIDTVTLNVQFLDEIYKYISRTPKAQTNEQLISLLDTYCIIQRYSFYRLRYGYKWWPDEQPSPEIKKYVENQLAKREINVVFSHTCPSKYIPAECFLSGVDQSKVDNSTEEWLDTIEDKLEYEAWYLGHWHTDKRIDKLHFLFHGIETL